MKRQEQIEQAAHTHAKVITPAGVGFSAERYEHFIDGALWADRHPKTKEQLDTDLIQYIDKFLQLYNEYCHIPSKQLIEFPTAKDYIIKKLNDEEKTSNEKVFQ